MRGLRRWGLLAAVVGAVAVAGVGVGLHSATFAAWLIPRFLPAGMTVGRVEGSLAGGLVIEAVDAPGVRVERVDLRLAVWPSLFGTPTLAALEARGLRIDPAGFPAEADPPETDAGFAWPERTPRFAIGPLWLRDIEIASAEAGEPLRIPEVRWRALTSRGDALDVDGLRIVGPTLTAAANGYVGWTGPSRLEAELHRDGLDLKLSIVGHPETGIDVELQQQAPFAARIHGTLKTLSTAPSADLRIEVPSTGAEAPLLAAVRGLAPLSADLRVRADPEVVQIDGLLGLSGRTLRLDGSRLRYRDARLQLAPLRVAVDEGLLAVEGEWPMSAAQADGELRVDGERLAWPGLPVSLDRVAAELRGRTDALSFMVDAGIRHDNRSLPLELAGRLADDTLLLERLSLSTGDGELAGTLRRDQGTGELEAELSARALDLAVLLPAHPTRLDGTLQVRGGASGWELDARSLQGTWRELPLSLDGSLRLAAGGVPVGRLDAELDGNRLTLAPTAEGHAARLQLARLQGVLPGATGRGRIDLRHAGNALFWQLELDELAWAGEAAPLTVRALGGEGRYTLGAEREVEAVLRLQGLARGDARYGPARLQIDGTEAAHRLALEAAGPHGTLTLAATGALDRGTGGPAWSGLVSALSLAVPDLPAPALALEAASPLELSAAELRLGRACLRREAAALCVEAQLALQEPAPGRVLLDFTGLDLAMLPVAPDAAGALSGDLEGRLVLGWSGTALTSVEAEAAAPSIAYTRSEDEQNRTWTLDAPALRTSGPPDALTLGLTARLRDAGPVSLTASGVGGDALAAELSVDFDNLRWLEGLSPELVAPDGRLAGRVTLTGPPAQLGFGGALQLAGFGAELPGAGVRLRGGELDIRLGEAGLLAMTGKIGSGEGELRIDASAQLDDAGQPQLDASLRGERVLVADLPNVRLLASPDVRLSTRSGVLRATGTLGLPEGLLDLQRFEPAVSASPDVVVLDRPVATPAPVQTDIRYRLGPALKLRGFGLDAALSGNVRVRSRPGRPVTATGTVDLSGGYRAYGQKLTIDRGRLLWANAPIGNPGFDFSAYRTIDPMKAGVRVRGSAAAPELTVYTEPPREASDALSWLVLGRPLSSASGDDGQRLSAAAGALGSVGGALIGATIGQRLGVEINVESSAELGGSPAFTVGKMLSPKLFVGFGRSLFDSAQLVIVRYRLTDRYELEALSGRETRIGANYRHEH